MQLGSILRATDYFRRSPSRAGGRRGHKEWLHFSVRQPDLDVLVNFGVSDDPRTTANLHSEQGHVIVLVRENEHWFGDVDRYWESDLDVAGGELCARMGNSSVELSGDGVFRVRASLQEVPVAVDLELVPETFPSFTNNVRLCDGQSLSWLAVPRLRASGHIRTMGRTHLVRDAIAYHDHNWGHFAWGADFAWEWAYGAPLDAACPWSFMFVRLSDRAMTSTKTQALTLWRGPDIVRSFRGRELRVTHGGGFAAHRALKVPTVMGLLAAGSATEVPDRITVEATSGDDVFTIRLEPRSVAQVIVPNDRSLGVTIINEVGTWLRASGRVLDETIDYEGGGMCEVLAS